MDTKDEFLSRVRHQIESEEHYATLLDSAYLKLSHSKRLLYVFVGIFIFVAIGSIFYYDTFEDVLIVWIDAVYLIYMAYFFLMMIPSFGTDSGIKLTDKSILEIIRDFLRLANLIKTVHRNKITLIEFFWNAFIINTKAIARGFSILFIGNVICAGVLLILGDMHWTTFLILVGQTVVILMMYYKIRKAEPGAPGFFTKIGIPDEFIDMKNIKKSVVVWILVGFFSVFTILILIGAMMFPGMTFGGYLSGISVDPMKYPVLLIATIAFLGLWMRYMQGVDSRKVMQKLNATHLSVLKDELMPAAIVATEEDLPLIKRRFVLLSMNKLIVQEFFMRFPVYCLMPDVFIVFDKVSQEILNDKSAEDKKLKDLL